MRRRVTGDITMPNNIVPMQPAPPRAGALSPLNPKARVPGALNGLMASSINVPSNLNPAAALTHAQKQRGLSISRGNK